MKNNSKHSYFLIVFFAFLFSCGETNPIQQEEPDAISDIITELNIASGASTQSISFSTNKKWEAFITSAQGEKSWCKISPANGNAGSVDIIVTTTENTGYDDRNVILIVKTGNTVKNINITQKQKNAIIISKSNFEIPEDGGTFEVEANTNVDLEVSIPTDATWIKEQTTGTRALSLKKMQFNVDENKTDNVRETIITFKDKKSALFSIIKVVQNAKKPPARRTIETQLGKLGELLGSDYLQIEELIIRGKLNGNDISIIHSMPLLHYLDIYETFIVSYDDEKSNKIYEEMFKGCRTLRTIILPNNVESIQNYAFYKCTSLTSITIPNSVTSIGSRAFSDCTSLTSITIPNSVKSISVSAFEYCTNLKGLSAAHDNDYYSDIDGVLTNKDKTILILYPWGKSSQYTIPNSVASIGGAAFRGCTGLTSITIPNSVTSIGSSAFSHCTNLTSITIPNSVTSIGSNAFDACTGLTSITIPNSVASIGTAAFQGCTGLTSITIPNSVTSIGSYAFNACTSLNSIILPNNITKIYSGTFHHCKELVSIIVPDNVTTIYEGAFAYCEKLTSIYLGSGITELGNYYNSSYSSVFAFCNNIKDIHIKAVKPPHYYNGDIPYKSSIKLYIPKGTKEAYQNDYRWTGFYQYIEE